MRDLIKVAFTLSILMGSRCLKDLVKACERLRKKRGLKRRYHGTPAYKLQTDPDRDLKAATALKSAPSDF
jgi:hypothetical protein